MNNNGIVKKKELIVPTIIPDDILATLTCSLCDKYLSVLPVKVYPDGSTRCGRCCEEEDGGAKSMFGTIVENNLFPCINRYNGCTEVMRTSEVEKHEESCLGISSSYQCPACDCDFEASMCYCLYRHALVAHEDDFLNSCEIQLSLNYDLNDTYFFCKKYSLFAINISFASKDKTLKFYVTHFNNDDKCKCMFFLTEECSENLLAVVSFNTCENINDVEKVEAIPTGDIQNLLIKFIFDIPQNITEKFFNPKTLQKHAEAQTLIKSPCNLNEIPSADVHGIMFSYTIRDFRQMIAKESVTLYSPIYYLNKIPVELKVTIDPIDTERSFQVFLVVDRNKKLERPWSCQAKFEFTLVSFEPNVEDKTLEANHLFSETRYKKLEPRDWGYSNFKCLYDILNPKNGFIKDNSVKLRAKVELSSVKIGKETAQQVPA